MRCEPLSARDFGAEAQQAAERRLAYCNLVLWDYGEGDEEGEPPPPGPGEEPAGAYCGCDTCTVREILDAAWAPILEAVRFQVNAEMNVRPIDPVE